MSLFSSVFAGFGLRSATPEFQKGETITAFVTGVDDGDAIVRIGDSHLRVTGVDNAASLVDERVELRVESFDEGNNLGEATLLEVIPGRGI
ncbi:DUF7513 family protein [Haloarchaeobius sp. TZWWS8]|uniref:DUF7513 family protein n=1 Tax=Haloarchaeobius sp. TZWWS8 TaxID=3446121 RepID=UPI003EC01CDD